MRLKYFLSLKFSLKNHFFLLLPIFFLYGYGESLLAQNNDYISYDDGCTYQPNGELNYTPGSSVPNTESYIRIKKIFDNQHPAIFTPLVFGDANNNGMIEMYRSIYISPTNNFIRVYEFDSDLNYTTADLPWYGLLWAFGDIDGNGKTDIVVQSGEPGIPPPPRNGYLRIYESPDANSFPSVLKQEIVLPGKRVTYYAKIVDLDLDNQKEVLMSANGLDDSGDIRIYEWESGNLILKWVSPDITKPNFTKAVADFDGDGNIEFASIEQGSKKIYAYENSGNDTYTLTQSWAISAGTGLYDALDATNPDGGNPELCIGLRYSSGTDYQYQWIIYKETNNTFNQWWTTNFPLNPNNLSGVPGHTTGDYDNDGFDEILVNDFPFIKMLEYEDNHMQETWTNELSFPTDLMSVDLRNNNVQNFVVKNHTYIKDTLIFFEKDFPPAAPQNLAITNTSSGALLTWDANTEPDLAGYEVYRKVDNGPINKISGNNLVTTNSYYVCDIYVTNRGWNEHAYYVKAVDIADNTSDYSTPLIVGVQFISCNATEKVATGPLGNPNVVEAYSLEANFPNPFNPVTKISFALPEKALVQLRVFDINGRQVAELINKEIDAGEHEVIFDANNLPSGVYLYRLTTRTFNQTRKMMLLK